MNILPWKTNSDSPEDRTLALILINGKIAADVFVWFGKQEVFICHSLFGKGKTAKIVENRVDLDEVDAWICIAELPLPVWVAGRA